MPHVEKHAPGSFNWIELGTTDQKAATQFYGPLLGWQAEDLPMGPDFYYTMFTLSGGAVAGCFAIHGGQPMPPNWGLYVAVENADAAAARATELGATVLRPPSDVFTFGRMATIQDPTGAVFAIWEAKTHVGTGTAGENGTLCWADLNTADRPAAEAFYGALFGWSFVAGADKPPDSYLHIKNGDAYIGGILPDTHRNHNAPPHWLIYFLVADCDAATAKATALGARIYVPPLSVENNLRYSVLADPQGAVFALFQRSV